jgi:pimeloyl-ACP methyl ester carboxylesterase
METVQLEGRGTIAYQWTGEGPETVVLVNGSIFNYHQWDGQPLPILQRGLGGRCRFLQYDYVGIGGSSAKTAPFSMQDLARELHDLLNALAVERVHLLGISKGSMVGQAFIICYPDRVKSFCGLGNPNLLSEALQSTWMLFKERLEALQDLKELWPERVNRQNYNRLFNHVYVPAFLQKQYTDLSMGERLKIAIVRRMVFPSLEGTFNQTIVDLFRYYTDLEKGITQEAPFFAEGLPKVHGIPILLLNGTEDIITPIQLSRELAEILPEATLVEFESVTHMGPMMVSAEAKPVFERYVAFLEELLQGE